MNKGFFITIEGGDGCGKTTIVQLLRSYVDNRLRPFRRKLIVSREPGGVDVSEKIRNIILYEDMDGITEALLYASARREHLTHVIVPNLEQGNVVMLDRYIDSSLAYQGYARGLGISNVLEINKLAIGNYMPDLTIYLDVDPGVALGRLNNDREINRLDKESLEFHEKVREGYLFLAKEIFPERINLVNANNDVEKVYRDCVDIIDKYLGEICN